ncbi:hypothetical protein PVAND_007816 [Polypedilum vanderplanki]|uniref:Uncharacterized protein n=1 Tax=Polypedilum vanderplanki TaxID=319348 RepID=A0A9J6C850_POLVA|nr:hypothetical protein PVAND_007816 [Polypedilum vanderplanki]
MTEIKLIIAFIFQLTAAINLLRKSENINCNGEKRFSSFDQVIYIYYPQSELTPTKCFYLVQSPVNTYISAKIYHNLNGIEPNCRGQKVLVSRDGDSELKGSSVFCGLRKNRPMEISSIGNEMTFGIISNSSTSSVQIILRITKFTQNNCDCSWNIGKKIVGGSNTLPNEFIAHAAFVTHLNEFNQSICGGTIISQNYILTCAHCILAIKNVFKWNVMIAVGRHNISAPANRDTIYADYYKISSAIMHKGYRRKTNDNDIALVRTAKYMKFNRGCGAACLPFAYENFIVPTGTIMTAIGFGSTQFAMSANIDRQSWILQKVQLTVNNSLIHCQNDTRKLCAIGDFNDKIKLRGDSCQRDSGSGLYGYMRNRYVLFGITSSGYACGEKKSYSINVYVAKYLAWIRSIIGSSEFLCIK